MTIFAIASGCFGILWFLNINGAGFEKPMLLFQTKIRPLKISIALGVIYYVFRWLA